MTMRFLLLFLLTGLSALAESITILGINDMHAALEQMPKLYTAVQQERTADPELILLSAGDNRTGNPFSDMDDEPGMPMVRLMNVRWVSWCCRPARSCAWGPSIPSG